MCECVHVHEKFISFEIPWRNSWACNRHARILCKIFACSARCSLCCDLCSVHCSPVYRLYMCKPWKRREDYPHRLVAEPLSGKILGDDDLFACADKSDSLNLLCPIFASLSLCFLFARVVSHSAQSIGCRLHLSSILHYTTHTHSLCDALY